MTQEGSGHGRCLTCVMKKYKIQMKEGYLL